jgi:hypothetical protein
VISVNGPSSFSSREKVLSSIKRGYKEKSPLDGKTGAGLGLYLIYENNQSQHGRFSTLSKNLYLKYLEGTFNGECKEIK